MRIALDIETLQASKEEWFSLMGINPGNQESELAKYEKEFDRSMSDATFSKIICIGMLLFKDDMSPLDAIAWYGSNEEDILKGFWQRMSSERPELMITHNGLSFDLPFIKKRSIINRVKPSVEINLARFQTRPVFDTMAVWANWELRNSVRLDVLARALGVETKTGSGDKVASMWSQRQWKEVADYCLQDAYVTYACYCRMSYIEPLKSSTVLSKKNIYCID